MSAARQAAEAAFAQPRPNVIQNSQAQVTVRRARLAKHQPFETALDALPAPPVAKRPRIFSVESARTPVASSVPSSVPSSAQLFTAPAAPWKPRKSLAKVKQPGPVVVHNPPLPKLPQQRKAAVTAVDLMASLDQVAPILVAVTQAQAFWFYDTALETRYQQLSARARDLLGQLRQGRPSSGGFDRHHGPKG